MGTRGVRGVWFVGLMYIPETDIIELQEQWLKKKEGKSKKDGQ
jgi:hypothetical protein